ncbi:MAG: DUF4384 domain-containing protein [Thermodesulfobacteriota bacterium]
MRVSIIFLLILALLAPAAALAGGSVIVEAKGIAAMGEDRSRKDTERLAREDAKRQAAEAASTFIRSETSVKDYVTEKDLVEAFSQAMVKVLSELSSSWFKDPGAGESFQVTVRAEVTPYTPAMKKAEEQKTWNSDPRAPLSVTISPDKPSYRAGESMKLYLSGNKPFYARVVYRDASGTLTQILPNPYRKQNYFQGGSVYRLPDGPDQYELTVSPPFGSEQVLVYASTEPLPEEGVKANGPVYAVTQTGEALSVSTRGISIKPQAGSQQGAAAEFFEASADLITLP